MKPTEVATPKQAGEAFPLWDMAERSVWTDRMLGALARGGPEGGKWFSLCDKVWKLGNLESSARRVVSNHGACGVDGQSVEKFAARVDRELPALADELSRDVYKPLPSRRVWIDKPGSKDKRPLAVPAVRDRVAQTAVRNVLEPIFEAEFAENSFGFRPGRGCKDALRVVDAALRGGMEYVVDADLKKYFDSIPHEALLERIAGEVSDGRLLSLVRMFLEQKVMEGLAEWTPEEGAPQGSALSPLLANIYLDPLDHLLAGEGLLMVRYADDFVILTRTRQEAERALEIVKAWVDAAGLTLHPEKTRVSEVRGEGFDFLGYRFHRGYKLPRKKSEDKLKDAIRRITRRNNGKSLDGVIATLNPVLRGWYEYFKHCLKNVLAELDGWTRRRLRAILLRREYKQSSWVGARTPRAHKDWPNTFFAEHGLFSLKAAHASEVQSRRRA